MESTKRTFIKTISYRFVGMLVLFVTGLIFAKDVSWILKFVVFSWTIGLAMFFTHEWVWARFSVLKKGLKDRKLRSVWKTVTWRLWSLLAVFLTTTLLLGATVKEGLAYTIVTNILFLVVHYTHERVWNLTDWGRKES